jgi:ubiquinone/menaquinone biosynthesis C-methylase UbiE
MASGMDKEQARVKLFKQFGYDIPRARKFILDKSGLTKKDTILEIGTGRGHAALALAKKGLRVISIDVDKEGQRATRIKLKSEKLDKRVILKIMDAERLRFKDNSFENVISVNFIHHAKNPVRCLKEMVRVTREKLIIADINKRGERIMARVHGLEGHSHPPSRISLDSVKKLLKKLGMDVKTFRDCCQTVLIAKKGAVK